MAEINEIQKAPSVPLNPNPEKETKKELLLNERYAGLHGALLLNGEMPGAGKTLDIEKLKEVQKNIIEGKSFEDTKLTNGSKQERDDYWAKKTEYKSFEEQKKAWIDSTKKFLEFYNNKPEMEILGRLGMKAGGENEIYDKYFSTTGEGKGDMGYFATTLATKLSRDEIETYSELIGKIGGFYGENSSAVAKHLTEAVKNVKVNYPDFEKAAVEQFNKGESMEGIDILKGVDERSKRWEEKQAKIKEAARIQKEKDEAAAEEKRKQAVLIKEQNEKKTQLSSLEKDKDGVEDAYNIVANQDVDKIKEEWKGHEKFTVSAVNEPVVIDEEVIRDYNELVAKKAVSEDKEVPFFFVEDTENKRIVKIFAGEAKSYGSTELSPLTAKAKNGGVFADWWNGENEKNNLFNGKEGRFKVGMGHTHPKGYGPIFSNVGEGDFGLDYSSEFEFRSSAIFAANPCASNISFVGSPEMGLLSAFEAKPDGVIEFHPIKISELKEQEVSPQKKEVIDVNEPVKSEVKEAFKGLSEGMKSANISFAKKHDSEIRTAVDEPSKEKLKKEFYNMLEEPWTEDFDIKHFEDNYSLKNDLRNTLREKFNIDELRSLFDLMGTVAAPEREKEKIEQIVDKEAFEKISGERIEFDEIKNLKIRELSHIVGILHNEKINEKYKKGDTKK